MTCDFFMLCSSSNAFFTTSLSDKQQFFFFKNSSNFSLSFSILNIIKRFLSYFDILLSDFTQNHFLLYLFYSKWQKMSIYCVIKTRTFVRQEVAFIDRIFYFSIFFGCFVCKYTKTDIEASISNAETSCEIPRIFGITYNIYVVSRIPSRKSLPSAYQNI